MSRFQATAPAEASAAAAPPAPHQLCQPTGLYVLCIVECCERFAATTMSSLLVFYLTEQRGETQSETLRRLGTFQALCYLAPLVGGFLADQTLGPSRTVLLGAALLAIAYGVLGLFPSPSLLLTSGLLVMGHGLFKPSINALLSNLYGAADLRREAAHSWFYLAANLGALLAPLTAGLAHAKGGFRVVFLIAAISMLLGVLVLLIGFRQVTPQSAQPHAVAQPWCAARNPRRQLSAVTLLALCLTLFAGAAALGQCDGVLLLWARDDVQRQLLGFEIPVAWFAALPALLVLVLGPTLTLLDMHAARRGRIMSASAKILAGLQCIALAFAVLALAARWHGDSEKMNPAWLFLAYLLLTLGELMIIPLTQALMTQFIPACRAGFAGSLWFAVLAAGYWLAGMLGSCWTRVSHACFFAGLALFVLAISLVVRWGSQASKPPSS